LREQEDLTPPLRGDLLLDKERVETCFRVRCFGVRFSYSLRLTPPCDPSSMPKLPSRDEWGSGAA
jgi:hypothetical protein